MAQPAMIRMTRSMDPTLAFMGGREDWSLWAGENQAESAFSATEDWLKGKSKYLGETSLVPVEYRYRWSMAYIESGNLGRPTKLELDNILNDLFLPACQ